MPCCAGSLIRAPARHRCPPASHAAVFAAGGGAPGGLGAGGRLRAHACALLSELRHLRQQGRPSPWSGTLAPGRQQGPGLQRPAAAGRPPAALRWSSRCLAAGGAAELTAARPAACARRNCQPSKPCVAPAVAASAAHKWLLALHCAVHGADGSRQQGCPRIRALYATCCNPGRHGHGGTSHINHRVQRKELNGEPHCPADMPGGQLDLQAKISVLSGFCKVASYGCVGRTMLGG